MQIAKVTHVEAAQELLRRRRARSSLAEYIEYVSGKAPARHMRFLCDKLENAMNTRDHRLLICEPPGHAKSFITSHHFPAWYLSKYPDHNIVAASHTDAFAEDWGRKVRNLMLGDEHRTLFPEVTVSEDSRAAGRWNVVTGGSYYATGVGGAVTGRRANCVSGDTIVETLDGPKCIKDIDITSSSCYVLSYEPPVWKTSHPGVYRRVLAVARRRAPERLRIRTTAGNTLEATGEHLVFTDRGFYPAQTLNPGDVLLRAVRETGGACAVRGVKENPQGKHTPVLQPVVRDTGEQRSAGLCPAEGVQHLFDADSTTARQEGAVCLLKGMSQRCFAEGLGRSSAFTRDAGSFLYDMFKNVFSRAPYAQGSLLFCAVQEHRTQQTDVWQREPSLSAWSGHQGESWEDRSQQQRAYPDNMEGRSDRDYQAGPKALRSVQNQRLARLSSHRLQPTEQQAGEFSNSMPQMPQHGSWGGAFETESDTVSVVETIREEGFVYDIEVEDTHCFFANGLLVHNCILVDDPIRGIEDADSPTVRDNMWSWWAADLSTRLVPGGIIILIQTRWHLDDLAGRVIASEGAGGDKWEKIILPALAKENDPLGRKPGEALWPEWQSKEALERIRRQPAITERIWHSLYQQSPVSESGNIVKRDWIKLWRSNEPPECKFVLQSWDTALTNKEKSAYSACLTFGVFDEPETGMPAMILLSRWRGRVEYHDLKIMARRLFHNYLDDRQDMPKHNPAKMSPDLLVIEDESSGKPLINEFAKAGIRAFAFPARKYGNKDQRLQLSLDIINSGRVYVPAIPPVFTQPRKFADEFITSLTSYPAASSRDDVDAFSQAIIKLKTSGWVYQPEDKPADPPWREHQPREALY